MKVHFPRSQKIKKIENFGFDAKKKGLATLIPYGEDLAIENQRLTGVLLFLFYESL